MGKHHRFLGDLTWWQVMGSAAAAVTAAWILSRLGAAGTVGGAAVGSVVVTITTSLYSHTLDRARTTVVRTERGTIVENPPDDEPAQPLNPWLVAITVLLVLLITLVGISLLELARGEAFSGDDGTTIGRTITEGEPPPKAPEEPTPTTPSPTEPSPTPTEPVETTPAEPTPTEPSPTPTETTGTIAP